MKKVFLDANVIADWALIAPQIIGIRNEKEKEDKLNELWKTYTAPKVSFEILELLRENRVRKFAFFTSDLALAEVGDVIFKELASINFARKGVAFRYIPKMIRKTALRGDEIDNIVNQIDLFRKIFLRKNGSKTKIKIHNNLRDPTLPVLLISSFRIETYDAYLISQAFDEKCHFFVTKEQDLREEVKIENLGMISPDFLYTEIKKSLHKK